MAKYPNSINTPALYGYSLPSVLRTTAFGHPLSGFGRPPALRLRLPTLKRHAFNVFGPLAHRLLRASRSQDVTSSTVGVACTRRPSTPASGADEEIYLLGHANSRVHGLRGLLNVIFEAFGLLCCWSRKKDYAQSLMGSFLSDPYIDVDQLIPFPPHIPYGRRPPVYVCLSLPLPLFPLGAAPLIRLVCPRRFQSVGVPTREMDGRGIRIDSSPGSLRPAFFPPPLPRCHASSRGLPHLPRRRATDDHDGSHLQAPPGRTATCHQVQQGAATGVDALRPEERLCWAFFRTGVGLVQGVVAVIAAVVVFLAAYLDPRHFDSWAFRTSSRQAPDTGGRQAPLPRRVDFFPWGFGLSTFLFRS
ncbi:hypothetical protein C8R44DRAFT_876020 [Mycena epipterygia]|nr:hypothetical protein C8R44DRAFT_876020 [Mycena epipterygia]